VILHWEAVTVLQLDHVSGADDTSYSIDQFTVLDCVWDFKTLGLSLQSRNFRVILRY
jgi:hypothetical protein